MWTRLLWRSSMPAWTRKTKRSCGWSEPMMLTLRAYFFTKMLPSLTDCGQIRASATFSSGWDLRREPAISSDDPADARHFRLQAACTNPTAMCEGSSKLQKGPDHESNLEAHFVIHDHCSFCIRRLGPNRDNRLNLGCRYGSDWRSSAG